MHMALENMTQAASIQLEQLLQRPPPPFTPQSSSGWTDLPRSAPGPTRPGRGARDGGEGERTSRTGPCGADPAADAAVTGPGETGGAEGLVGFVGTSVSSSLGGLKAKGDLMGGWWERSLLWSKYVFQQVLVSHDAAFLLIGCCRKKCWFVSLGVWADDSLINMCFFPNA